jgi:hypothetical protein
LSLYILDGPHFISWFCRIELRPTQILKFLPCRCSPFLLGVHIISRISIWISWILVCWRKIYLPFLPSHKRATSFLLYSQLQWVSTVKAYYVCYTILHHRKKINMGLLVRLNRHTWSFSNNALQFCISTSALAER